MPAATTCRVAVTGSRGFLGRHLVEVLRSDGRDVLEVDLDADTPADIRMPLPAGLFDGVDVVVHLAALAGVAPSRGRPADYVTTNVLGTTHVLQAAQAAGVRRVVAASSSSVYGHCDRPAHEDQPVAPMSPYAITKASADLLLAEATDRTGIQTVSIRPFTVYGPGQRPDMLIGRLLRGEALQLWPFERDFTYVGDLVPALARAVDADLPADHVAVNLGSGRPVTATELLDTIAQVTGTRPQVTWGEQRPGEPGRTWADTARARTLLGLAPDTDLDAGIAAQHADLLAGVR